MTWNGQTGPKGIDWDSQPLGEVSDASIARAVGCSAVAVYYARRRRGIAAPARGAVVATPGIEGMVRAAFRGTWIGGGR
jgi:ribosomal protein L35AE/L33A